MRSFVRIPPARSVSFFVALWALASIGCVSTETHTKALDELEAMKEQLASLQTNLDEEAAKRKAAEHQALSLEQERDALSSQSHALQTRLKGLEEDKNQLNNDLASVLNQISDLEQEHAEDNAFAQGEIDKLRQQAAAMEAEAAKNAAEQERLRQKQTRLAAESAEEHQRLRQEQAQLAAKYAAEQERLRQEQAQLAANLDQERQRAEAVAAEKARLEKEQLAKEEEIKRLTKTQEELSKSLQDEIAKGNITIQQVRDKLTINMVDRVLFDSGQAQIKPVGIKVLRQVGDILKRVADKHIRIEGHTDNVPISTKLQSRFQTNWELSTARATNVVRYLIEQSGVYRESLSAVGHADTRPIASNDTDEGRSANRRIEIVLYPKDLPGTTEEPHSTPHDGQ